MIPMNPIETQQEYDQGVKDIVSWLWVVTFVLASIAIFFVAILT